MPSQAKTNFDKNKKDIETLWKIHADYAGDGAGKKTPEVDVLNKAAIVFITACWETYIEDIAKEAFEFMLSNCDKPTDIPPKVRNFATLGILKQPDPSKIWNMAEDGWKVVLNEHRDNCLTKWLGDFNTPKTAQVNNLFEELIGIKNISHSWYWQKMSINQSSAKLDNYVGVRGDIAHRTKHDKKVLKTWGTKYINHVNSLVEKTDNKIYEHIQSVLRKQFWV